MLASSFESLHGQVLYFNQGNTIFQTTTEQPAIPASTEDLHCYYESGESEDYVTIEKKNLGEEKMTNRLTIPEGQSHI